MRHHVQDYFIGRLFVRVRKVHNLPVYTRPHILRHACLTHMAAHMMKQGIPEKMIKAALKDLAGHVMDQTLEGYCTSPRRRVPLCVPLLKIYDIMPTE